ncbi:MAG: methylated-DNA--[protein]-cysteine S-methyltransferase [Hydrogenophaga sp.]|nr:methylated-DNA--[protein]-cysteine S-methyltransferase [Hydrogenophaga sp.]
MIQVTEALFCEWFDTPVGDLVAVADDRHLRVLGFEEDGSPADRLERQRRRLGRDVIAAGNAITAAMGRELKAYFAGELFDFTLPLAPAGSEFEQKVWAELLKVPLGETCSYGDIARNVGGMETVRAVGKANGANPIAIVIPCHRCIGSDGSLTGYGGGLWRKKLLLRHEGEMRPVGLFAR